MNTATVGEASNRLMKNQLMGTASDVPELVRLRERIEEIRQGTDTILSQLCDLHRRLHGHHPIPQPEPSNSRGLSDSQSPPSGEIANLHDVLTSVLSNVNHLRLCADNLGRLA